MDARDGRNHTQRIRDIRQGRSVCPVCTCDPCVSRIPPGALRGTPPVFLKGVRLDLSEADRKASGPKHDRSMRFGEREQGPGALHKDFHAAIRGDRTGGAFRFGSVPGNRVYSVTTLAMKIWLSPRSRNRRYSAQHTVCFGWSLEHFKT